jgi:hypothetical protein
MWSGAADGKRMRPMRGGRCGASWEIGRWEAKGGRCEVSEGNRPQGEKSAQGEERRWPGWAGWDLVLLFHFLPFFFSNPFETPNLFEFKRTFEFKPCALIPIKHMHQHECTIMLFLK